MLTANTRLSISDQVVSRKVDDETVILDLTAGTYFGLDPIGSRFFELLEQEGTLNSVVARMLQEFDVSEEQLTTDLLKLVEEMVANGLLEAG
ncbi:MAG: PqqD family protein [Candidatus Competibacteraceae bacterium]